MGLKLEDHLSFFKKSFPGAGTPRCFRAPARINIIGEHVDYLGGTVLPAAIDFSLEVLIEPTSGNSYELASFAYQNTVHFPVHQNLEKNPNAPWADYVLGMVLEMRKRNKVVPPFRLSIAGDIPQGAGLSSSAALEVAVGFALNSIFGFSLSLTEIALMGQAAENNFVGTNCGIMDQFIIANGKKNHCISLNTSSLEFDYHQFQLGDWEFYLVNSNVKHSLKDSGYNTRRQECESALQKIQRRLKDTKDLYSFSVPESDWGDFGFIEEELRRVRHVVTEKTRTQSVITGLQKADFAQVGNALFEAHWSLSRDFEVSCPELDYLVSELKSLGVAGARMIGGGFGGCALVLDRKSNFLGTKERLETSYSLRFSIQIDFYRFQISEGVHEIIL